jgi:hypothetical protein
MVYMLITGKRAVLLNEMNLLVVSVPSVVYSWRESNGHRLMVAHSGIENTAAAADCTFRRLSGLAVQAECLGWQMHTYGQHKQMPL